MKKHLVHLVIPMGYGAFGSARIQVPKGLPLCGAAGAFTGSKVEENVTCRKCKKLMRTEVTRPVLQEGPLPGFSGHSDACGDAACDGRCKRDE